MNMSEINSEFTAHNVLLADGTQTLASAGYFMNQHPWFLATVRMLRAVYPGGLKGVRMVDLGCLEGGYSIEFARLGMDVLGLEIRESNFRNCMHVKSRSNLDNLKFVQDDAWNVERYGRFDVVLCFGLLYHLDKPTSFLHMLGDVCNKALFVHTHIAPVEASKTFDLSAMTQHEDAEGRWYTEFPDGLRVDRSASKWASLENNRSFWLRKEFVLGAIRDSGFDIVVEQYDWLGSQIADEMLRGMYTTSHRNMFVGIKSGENP
jgi:SAM-dependent methyltransferase